MSYRLLDSTLAALMKRGAHLGLGIGAFTPMLAMANPSGGQVVAGQATIGTQNANGLVINQATQSAIINWQQFNIGANEYVQFVQPSSSAVVLNRVVGGTPSSILGNLSANGQVFLVNTNGVYFGKGASVDVQGFLASTLDIDDSDFLAGNYHFGIAGAPGATVVNQGSIKAHDGGYVVLAGDYAQNTGIITAQSGHVILAAGSKATLNLSGNSLVNFAVDQATLASYAGVANSGYLIADGGTVVMTADVANALKATVVNNSGLIEAKSLSATKGKIYLTATGGDIQNSGTINANAGKVGAAGGDIVLKGDGKTVLTTASQITATGNGAHGGHLELSGTDLSVRGVTTMGKGGNILLDPNVVTIKMGSSFSSSSIHMGVGSGADADIGLAFIQDHLNAGTDVGISAHSLIHAASSVTKIKSTGTGKLHLRVASGGTIDLHGVTINIGGNLVTSGTGAGANMSFAQVIAKNVSIDAGSGNVHLAPAVTVNGVLKPSIRATGFNIDITAGTMDVGSGGGSLVMQAVDFIDLHGVELDNAGNVKLTATVDGIGLFSGARIQSAKNVTLTAGSYFGGNTAFDVSAGGNLAMRGAMGQGPNVGGSSARFFGAVDLKAGKTITLDHSVYASDSVSITGAHLNYTGAGIFTVSAGTGSLTLDAAIGTSTASVDYGVKLVDHNYGINVEKSIYTSKSILASQTGFHLHGGSGDEGVYVGGGASSEVVLSAKGAITLRGGDVYVGGPHGVTISADDGNAAVNKDNLKIIATSAVIISPDIGLPPGDDRDVTLHAGHDLDVSALGLVRIEGGQAFAALGLGTGQASFLLNTALTAGHDVNITGGSSHAHGQVWLMGGRAAAEAVAGASGTIDVQANLSIKAGHDVDVEAHHVLVRGGDHNSISASAAAGEKVTVKTGGSVAINAGHDLVISGSGASGSLLVRGGSSAASQANVGASGSNAAVNATLKQSVSLTAGNGLELTAGKKVTVEGGNSAANDAQLDASGKDASVKLAVDSSVKINAKLMLLMVGSASGDSLLVRGGDSAGRGVLMDGASTSVGEALNVKSGVTLGAHSAANLVGRQIDVRGGDHAGAARGSGSSITSTRIEVDGPMGTAAYSVATGVSINGGSSLLIQSDRDMELRGGSQAGKGLSAHIGTGAATATLAVQAGVSLVGHDTHVDTDTALGLLTVAGGDSAGLGASLQASAGQLTMTADAGFNLAGSIVYLANGILAQDFHLTGGDRAGASAQVQSGPSGVAQLGAHADVALTATGTLSVVAVRGLDIVGGASAAANAFAGKHSGSGGGSAAIAASAGVKLSGGSVSLSAFTTDISIAGGDGAAQAASVNAVAGQQASVSGDAAVSVTATTGGITLKGKHNFSLRGGAHAAGGRTTVTTTGPHASNSSSAGTAGTSSAGTYSAAAHRTGTTTNTQVRATGIGASATVTGAAGVSLSAKGGVSLVPSSAGGSVLVQGGSSAAASVAGSASAGKAVVAGTATVSVKAGGTLKLSGHMVTVRGGRRAAGAAGSYSVDGVSHCHSGAASCFDFVPSPSTSAHQPVQPDKAHSGGQVSVTGNAAVSLSGGSVTLTASSDLRISGGALALQSAHATTSSAGAVKLSGKAGVSIISTTGAMKLKAIQDLMVRDGASGGRFAQAQAVDDGSAALTATTTVKITAKTSLSVTGNHVTVQQAAGMLSDASASAAGVGSKISIVVDGRNSLKAGTNLSITGHSSVTLTASPDLFASDAPMAHVAGGGVSAVTGKTSLTVTASQNLTISGPSGISGAITIGSSGGGYSGSSGRVLIGGIVALKAGGDIAIAEVVRQPDTGLSLPVGRLKLGTLRDQANVMSLDTVLGGDPRGSGKQ